MVEFLNFTLLGLSYGLIYAAIGLSLVLIWRGTRVLNYAQGAMAMLTSYIALLVINATGNYWLGFAVALLSGLVVGAAVERIVIRQVTGKPPLNAVIVSIGLLIGLEGLAGLLFSSNNRSFPPAFSVNGLSIGSVALGITRNDVFTAVAVLAAAGVFAAVFRYTSVGLRLRATAFNSAVARLLGVRVGRMLTLGWALAGLLGALAGMLSSPSSFLSPNSMDGVFVLGFTAAVIGGLESPGGAVAGGVVIGLATTYATGYLNSQVDNLVGLAALLLVLMLRPNGLFSSAPARRV
jgi:branched-chain amino acid transport system permease protein